jgi:hypothetical protein
VKSLIIKLWINYIYKYKNLNENIKFFAPLVSSLTSYEFIIPFWELIFQIWDYIFRIWITVYYYSRKAHMLLTPPPPPSYSYVPGSQRSSPCCSCSYSAYIFLMLVCIWYTYPCCPHCTKPYFSQYTVGGVNKTKIFKKVRELKFKYLLSKT